MIKNLEENHDILTDIVIKEESNEISTALPKVLLDLVSQINRKYIEDTESKSNSSTYLNLEETSFKTENPTLETVVKDSGTLLQKYLMI